ncbi:ribonuclease VapC [Allostella sp. ATCC 35155]|nr:ribonuclease VapC [Stella sp. ATCC 35155]
MPKTVCFFDTNVLLYLISPDVRKAAQAEALMLDGGLVSVQVLNEFASVGTRKAGLSWTEIREVLELLRRFLLVVPVDLDIHLRALDLAERYRLSFYDAAIVAAAAQCGCSILWSEDMQSGQSFGDLRIENPFAASLR